MAQANKPRTEGSFSCSNESLSQAWQRGKEVARCTISNISDARPGRPQALAAYCCMPNEFPPEVLHKPQGDADTAQELEHVLALDDYYSFTGDDAVVCRQYESVRKLLDDAANEIGKNGRLQAGDPIGYLHYAALRAAGRMALHLDNKTDSNLLFLRSMDIKASLSAAPIPEDYLARALGVLYEVFPQDKAYAIGMRLFAAPPEDPKALLVGCAACSRAGWGREALQALLATAEQASGEQLELAPVHTWYLSTRVLGVIPLEPGFRSFAVQPQTNTLDWAEGSVPTPRGEVRVSWKCEGTTFELAANVPEGTTAEVSLAASRVNYPKVLCNGVQVWEENAYEKDQVAGIIDGELKNDRINFVLRPGEYRFEQVP